MNNESNEFLSEASKRKIYSLLPLIQSTFPSLQFSEYVVPATAHESISFMGKDNGVGVLQYSFWGDNLGEIYSVTVYSNDVTLESLYRKYSNSRYIFGFYIQDIELDKDERPYFIDIILEK